MKNNNSLKYWYNYYKNDFKSQCEFFKKDYITELRNWLSEFENNYNNRNDKTSKNPVVKDSLKGQLNQITAIKNILKEAITENESDMSEFLSIDTKKMKRELKRREGRNFENTKLYKHIQSYL